ncbi:hypothetical protein [Janthinobacterium psychrotolerans]|uniref:Uncharacterized protein n=1 Tax=Janthinobacterium psychrotolerans TaxID=1747903 RepID=A0A1A7C9X8_9BURK|nr:hypothetical protein [Janthinobacterium psychrotolerans]OBV41570.1 hypothetical protein ASR47_103513 [Janthinobacterium psychrotolerans]
MTPKLKKTIILLSLLASAVAAQAGSPDGLNIAAIGSANAVQYASAVKQFFSDYAADGIACGDYALRLQNVYTSDLPPQLTGELALGAANDKARHRKLGNILAGFRSKALPRGFDGALAYEVKGAQLRLYGISGASDEQVVVATLPVSQASDQKKFNLAACKALASLPVLAEP